MARKPPAVPPERRSYFSGAFRGGPEKRPKMFAREPGLMAFPEKVMRACAPGRLERGFGPDKKDFRTQVESSRKAIVGFPKRQGG